jgi:photosystem II stability/assembly factor-like uncharacterized protein
MKKFIILLLSFIIHYSLFIDHCSSQWSVQTFPFTGVVYGIAFKDVNNGVACGHSFGNFSEQIYYTTNSGANWIQASYPASLRSLPSVQYINATTLYAGGAENNVLLGGQLKYNFGFEKLPDYMKNRFLRLGINGLLGEYKGAFVKSTNSGLTWTNVTNFDTTSGFLLDIQFFNESTGYACADSGSFGNSRILRTTNGGINWQTIYLEPQIILYNINFIDVNTGFACGFSSVTSPGGFIFKTTNAGANWTKRSFLYPSVNEIKDICFLNSTTGIAVAQAGEGTALVKIYKSTNTGTTWDSITTFGNFLPESINFVTGTGTALITGWIDSSMLYVNYTLKTTNYGSTWVRKRIYANNQLIIKSSLVDQNNWYIGGGDYTSTAIVLKSTNGGGVFITQISNTVPDKFELFQNYPNPFNPTTKIKFDISSKLVGQTFLSVYDIQGRKIQTLINEQLQPGSYEVTFDARQPGLGSNLSSGLYFYQLRTDNFVDSRKMLMIK